MKNLHFTNKYVKALFALSIEKNKLDAIANNLKTILNCLKEAKNFSDFFINPLIPSYQKIKVFKSEFFSLEEEVLDFLMLIIKNKNEKILKDIILLFLEKFYLEKNILKVYITVPFSLTEEQKVQLKGIFEKKFGKTIMLVEKVDEKILGGIIIRVYDKVFDGSLRSKLEYFSKKLSEGGLYVTT